MRCPSADGIKQDRALLDTTSVEQIDPPAIFPHYMQAPIVQQPRKSSGLLASTAKTNIHHTNRYIWIFVIPFLRLPRQLCIHIF
ncbi:hypothetical protein WJ73_28915 [Burkholderia ubonensis]|nr:hypothetical protein WJ73_28915 [Burkholderia ubonensis]